MRLIAQIPCTFAGKKYLIGNEIPVEVVENPEAQAKRGTIAILKDGEDAAPLSDFASQAGEIKFGITIHAGQDDYTVLVTEEELQTFADVMQMGVKTNEEKEKIAEIISSIDSEELLILIDALDGRKAVKDAIKERVDALETPSEETPNSEPDKVPEE